MHAATSQDREGAKRVLQHLVLFPLVHRCPRLPVIWADGGSAGQLVDWPLTLGHWLLAIVKKDGQTPGFRVLPRRWVVERTFAWLGRCRRLSKDYEALPESSEAMIYLAMIRLMLRRLAVS